MRLPFLFLFLTSIAHGQSLKQKINKHLNLAKKDHIGVKVVSLKNNKVLYTKNDTQQFIPASAMKLITSIAGLNFLGPDYQFVTTLTTNGTIKNTVLEGDICLKGSGDPSLTTQDIHALVRLLKEKGITRIQGNIIIDPSVFDAELYAPLCTYINTEWRSPVGATLPTAGINVNHNYILKTRRAITNPTHYAGEQLYRALKKRGIHVKRTLTIKKTTYTTILASHVSEPLTDLLIHVLKDSDNLYADCIFKAIGAEHFGQGTWLNAHDRVTRYLTQTVHLNPADFYIADGSGLSRKNKATPHQFILLLIWAYYHFNYFDELFNTLPKSGTDGTLKGRINNPRVFAKTGTLTGISSLVGYCTHTKKKPTVFAIMAQGPSEAGHKKNIEDRIAKDIINHHHSQ